MKEPTTALSTAVQEVYRAFSSYRAPTVMLDVCTGCCMDAALERDMRQLPLRQLTREHFYQYNTSAKSEVQPANEIKYYLPRMLELLAQGAQLHHSVEIYLDRLGRCEPGTYSPREQAALQGYARVFFAQGLEQWPPRSDDLFQGEDAFSILLMWEYAKVPLQPLLDDWLAQPSEAATLSFVDACYWEYCLNGEAICNPFAKPPFQTTMHAWLTAPQTQSAWTHKLMTLVESSPPSDWRPVCNRCGQVHHPLDQRISTVFDAMTQ